MRVSLGKVQHHLRQVVVLDAGTSLLMLSAIIWRAPVLLLRLPSFARPSARSSPDHPRRPC